MSTSEQNLASTMERGVCESISPMERALTNSAILQEILKYTKVGKLRLVCKYWNEIIFSLPEPKLSLALDLGENYTFCNSHLFQEFVSSMNPKLARRLDIQELCRCPGGKEEHLQNLAKSTTSSPFGLREFCTKFSEEVHIFKVIGFIPLIPVLHDILMNGCPNLTRLDICLLGKNEEKSEIPVPPPVQEVNVNLPPGLIPTKSKLQSVVVHVHNPDYSSLPQQIINSADTNLERIRIFGNWFPDLDLNTRIRYVFCTCTVDPTLNLEKLSRMLDQVAGSVNHLELGIFIENYEINWNGLEASETCNLQFQIPEMPKLKYFKTGSISIFRCGDSLQDIGSSRMKSLETLEISTTDGEGDRGNIDELLGNVSKLENHFESVTTLILNGIQNPITLIPLRTSFPVLETLDISAVEVEAVSSREELLGQVLKSCGALKLKKLTLSVPFPSTMSTFIKILSDGLESFPSISALKMLDIKHFVAANCSMVRLHDDLPQCKEKDEGPELIYLFKKALSSTKGMTRVSISGLLFSGETAQVIVSYIAEQGLPVEFRDS